MLAHPDLDCYQRVTFYLCPDAKSQWVEFTFFFICTMKRDKKKKKIMKEFAFKKKEKSIIAKKKKNIPLFAIIVF